MASRAPWYQFHGTWNAPSKKIVSYGLEINVRELICYIALPISMSFISVIKLFERIFPVGYAMFVDEKSLEKRQPRDSRSD